jgi:hypothetical protein
MRGLRVSLLVLVALSAPAGALLFDDEPDNDSIPTAGVMLIPTATDTADAGRLSLEAGDSDYLGIGGLVAGDSLTVATMPMQGSHFDIPDTIVGVFTDFGTEKCINDDAANSDGRRGLGSLCRVLIGSPGTYYVGVTGFSNAPFDGNHSEVGDYVLSVSLTTVPEPGRLLLLVAGTAVLMALGRIRARSGRELARPVLNDAPRNARRHLRSARCAYRQTASPRRCSR